MKDSFEELKHIAVIMDGNGRWAKARGKPRWFGHRQGVLVLEKILQRAFEIGVRYFTCYAFSTENRTRPPEEVDNISLLIKEFLKKKHKQFIKEKIKFITIGDKGFFDSEVNRLIEKTEAATKNFEKVFIMALNYGSHEEILRAVNEAVQEGKKQTIQSFSKKLYTSGIVDPDIIIRTGGEKRLSNFLLFQASYSELFFIDDLWPDFSTERLEEIISEYKKRERRYGTVTNNEG